MKIERIGEVRPCQNGRVMRRLIVGGEIVTEFAADAESLPERTVGQVVELVWRSYRVNGVEKAERVILDEAL